ncbi:hypothetical protein BDC45DRAFT_493170 [Circinella umbellata]|nr:hypothetical protein BDC45DRAFT_493170 [Circinella umbellata]
MKLFSTLSLIIGSFLVAVKSQEFTAGFVYTVSIAGLPDTKYELSCNVPDIQSNHPMATQACQELQSISNIATETGQTVSEILRFYLSPTQPLSLDPSCKVFGGEATLNIILGQIQSEVISGDLGSFSLKYPNGCSMKMAALQAGLFHFLPFHETDSLPVPPL